MRNSLDPQFRNYGRAVPQFRFSQLLSQKDILSVQLPKERMFDGRTGVKLFTFARFRRIYARVTRAGVARAGDGTRGGKAGLASGNSTCEKLIIEKLEFLQPDRMKVTGKRSSGLR